MALVSLSTVVQAQRTYAAMNGMLFDSMTCLMKPYECIPGQKDAAPVLDPGYDWLEPRLGYQLRFHPGPGAGAEEIRRGPWSASSIKAFAVTLTPELPEMKGARGFCGDSGGRMCLSDGGTPPVRDGRCEPCKKLQ
jgi:hypothetical protein